MLLDLLVDIIRILIASIFISYGISKLQALSFFETSIDQHRLLPRFLVKPTAISLPTLEIILGMLFIFNVAVIFTGLTLIILLGGFSAVLGRALISPQLGVQDCGCGAGDTHKQWSVRAGLIRNCILLIAILGILNNQRSTDTFSHEWIFLTEMLALLAAVMPLLLWRISALEGIQKGAKYLSKSFLANTTTSITQRRAFFRWSAITGMTAFATLFVGSTHQAKAYKCSCYCNSTGGRGPTCYDTWNCDGHIGQFVAIYLACDTYCCPPAPVNYCDTTMELTPRIAFCPGTCS